MFTIQVLWNIYIPIFDNCQQGACQCRDYMHVTLGPKCCMQQEMSMVTYFPLISGLLLLSLETCFSYLIIIYIWHIIYSISAQSYICTRVSKLSTVCCGCEVIDAFIFIKLFDLALLNLWCPVTMVTNQNHQTFWNYQDLSAYHIILI